MRSDQSEALMSFLEIAVWPFRFLARRSHLAPTGQGIIT
jgi:hypothetical protein